MQIKTTIAMLTVAALLPAGAAKGQDLFRVTFTATCGSVNSTGNRITYTTITDKDLVKTYAPGMSTKQVGLVYNTAADSLQVATTNGTILADIFNFGGGTSITAGKNADRLTFIFLPSETGVSNAIGSAIITETQSHTNKNINAQRAMILGKMQFALVGGYTLGSTNAPGFTSTNSTFSSMFGTNSSPGGGFYMNTNYLDSTAMICSGTFSSSTFLGMAMINTNSSGTNIPPVSTP